MTIQNSNIIAKLKLYSVSQKKKRRQFCKIIDGQLILQLLYNTTPLFAWQYLMRHVLQYQIRRKAKKNIKRSYIYLRHCFILSSPVLEKKHHRKKYPHFRFSWNATFRDFSVTEMWWMAHFSDNSVNFHCRLSITIQ